MTDLKLLAWVIARIAALFYVAFILLG